MMWVGVGLERVVLEGKEHDVGGGGAREGGVGRRGFEPGAK